MQRINVTDGVRIGALQHYVKVWRPTMTLDPATGGMVPGPPTLILEMFAGIEPFELDVVREKLAGGAITNIAQMMVTCWYQSSLRVADYIEYTDARANKVRHLEIMTLRDQAENHRYQEMVCQEKVA
jgi:hypothetical protein